MISDHAYDRLDGAGISYSEIERGISTAIVVEDYPDANRGPSVLVLQVDKHGKPLHVVWGFRTGTTSPAVIITAYRPDPQLWSADFRRRL